MVFPFKRIVSIHTIIDWINSFEWEVHRLEKQYESNNTIDDTVNEFNQLQITRKSKRINILNNALDALLNINIKLSMKLATINPENTDGSVNTNYKDLTALITNLGYLYKALESLHDTQTVAVNTFKGYTTDWQEIKERLKPHHNPNNTSEDNLESNIQTIDYFYDNYVNTE